MNEIVFEKCELNKAAGTLDDRSGRGINILCAHRGLEAQGDSLILSCYRKLSSVKEAIESQEELLFLNSYEEISFKLKTEPSLIFKHNDHYLFSLKYPIVFGFEELKKATLDDKFRKENQSIVVVNNECHISTRKVLNDFVIKSFQDPSSTNYYFQNTYFLLRFDPLEAKKLVHQQQEYNTERIKEYEAARATYEESKKVITNQKFILLVTEMFAKEYVRQLGAAEVGKLVLAPKSSKDISKTLDKAKVFFDLMDEASRVTSINNHLRTLSAPHLISFIEKQTPKLKKDKILNLILSEAKKQQTAHKE